MTSQRRTSSIPIPPDPDRGLIEGGAATGVTNTQLGALFVLAGAVVIAVSAGAIWLPLGGIVFGLIVAGMGVIVARTVDA